MIIKHIFLGLGWCDVYGDTRLSYAKIGIVKETAYIDFAYDIWCITL